MRFVIVRKSLLYVQTTLALYVGLLGASPTTAKPVLGPNDGSSQIEELARKGPAELDRKLKDYPSARFRDVTGHYVDYQADRYFYLCGFLNSKNSMGGYRGWIQFMLSETYAPSHGVALSVADNTVDAELVTQMCDEDTKGRTLKDYSNLLTYRSRH